MPPPRVTEFPFRINAPAGLLKVIPLKTVPEAMLLVLLRRVVLPKKRKSPDYGVTLASQFGPVSQLLSPPPPSHVRLAPEALDKVADKIKTQPAWRRVQGKK